jgi:hypothetical protein
MINMKFHTVKGTLIPQPPFDFQKSLDFIREFAPMRVERSESAYSLLRSDGSERPAYQQLRNVGE